MTSYEEILGRMTDTFSEQAGFVPDRASDIGMRLRVLAGEIHGLLGELDWLHRQSFPQSAVGQELDYHAETRGLKRKSAVRARGELTFRREEALWYDVEISAGTVCSTLGSGGLRYRTTEAATLPAGELFITAPAEAEEGGDAYNVSTSRVSVLITPPAGINGVSNEVAFQGGVDGEEDDALRERLLKSYAEIPNGTNAAFYRDHVLRYEGISTVSVVPMGRGVGTVDIYVACNGGIPENGLMAEIQSDLEKLREICVDVQVLPAALVNTSVFMTVKPKAGYGMSEVRADCIEAINQYFAGLAIGESALLAGIGRAIFALEGVENYSFVTNMCSDKHVNHTQLAVPGQVGIAQEGA